MASTIEILSALADPTRLAALRLLWDGREHCGCELMHALGKSQSCTSRHMTSLKRIGLIVDRRDAQWVRYRRNPQIPKSIAALVRAILALDSSIQRKKT